MGFYDKLAGGVPQSRQVVPAPAPSQGPWWQGGSPQVPQQQQQALAPTYQPVDIETAIAQKTNGSFTGGPNAARVLKGLKQTLDHCPECDSLSYVTVQRTRNGDIKRCFECGYPVLQQGSGVSSPTPAAGGGAVAPARQLPQNTHIGKFDVFHHM